MDSQTNSIIELTQGKGTFHCLFFPEVWDSRELSFYIKSKTSKHLIIMKKSFTMDSLKDVKVILCHWDFMGKAGSKHCLSQLPHKSTRLETLESASVAWKLSP